MTLLRTADCWSQLEQLLARYQLTLTRVADGAPIPGSYWGDCEAGLRDTRVFARADTPVHSVLHETSHVVCMTPARRALLDTDAGGGYDEENSVCVLQILLASELYTDSTNAACADMDQWGYTFRLGSARAFFERDATDARDWLVQHGLVSAAFEPTFALRQ